ncbi:sensor histidine kinase [Biomphalaria pfeifferi]|uniref:Sensor histidine kinase n=1 Tax=Biomphalaria pfeifferi TaxID=112525 RepID=A0AAD8AND4_BIOPF|nr:sensor histidine kinase [Biomphalaria pfeifferi]
MLSPVLTSPERAIRLVTDERSLREQYRFAFANHYTVVQELLQNARRAGATRVEITYDAPSCTLTVADDGCGIADFQILLTFAGSGWDEDVAQAERPYGFGFASALYVANHVEVTSRGSRLVFDTAGLLAGNTYSPTQCPLQEGTTITLRGVELKTPADTLAKVVAGFAIPVSFNGRDLSRPDAIDSGSYESTPVGLVRSCEKFEGSALAVYLQGFLVYRSHSFYRRDVVHLDGARYRGKWPDRDRCLDEDLMVAEVSSAVRSVYEARLAKMKSELAPIVFCRQAYELARSLGRLEVFNDIHVVPGEWLGVLTSMPHTLSDGDALPLQPVAGEVSRQAVEAREFPLCPIPADEGFGALEYSDGDTNPGADQLVWVHAFASGARVLMQHLHHHHWLRNAVEADHSGSPQLLYSVLHEGRIPSNRTHWIGYTRLLLTTVPTLESNGTSAITHEAFAANVGGETAIVVPCTSDGTGNMVASYVTGSCLRQCYTYIGDDDCLDEVALETDEAEANQLVRLLLAKSPKEHLQSVLSAALGTYSDELKRYSRMTVSVDDAGHVTVLDLAEATAT